MPDATTPRATSTTWIDRPGIRTYFRNGTLARQLPRQPGEALGEHHQRDRHDDDHAGYGGGSHVEVRVDLLPQMNRQHFGAFVGEEERHRHVVERRHERKERPGADA